MSLEEYNGQPLLKTTIVREIDGIANKWQTVSGSMTLLSEVLNDKSSNSKTLDAYQMNVTIDASRDFEIKLSNSNHDEYSVRYLASSREVIINRGAKTAIQTSTPTLPYPIFAPLSILTKNG